MVVHIRTPQELYLPFEYYEKALSMAKYDKIYICTDDPNHEYLKNFKKYNPIIIRHKDPYSWEATIDDFAFIMSFNKIITSQSTFCWWAAFLSSATEIYAPRPSNGFMSNSNITLEVTDEIRYKYINC